MTFSESVLQYYRQLTGPANLPEGVETMNPYQNPDTFRICEIFYNKYYADRQSRIICFGINPGRYGAGITGIPFTDPVHLEEVCNIPNVFEKRNELSSRFIYEMIRNYGGPDLFFNKVYISAVSPLGYIQDGINLNYYDLKGFKTLFESYVVEQIEKQLKFNINRQVAFSIGKGENIKYLRYINNKHNFFEAIEPLPHPRWVMQYRLKRKHEFIEQYVQALQI
ncbi:MAG: DUF4918 family protein [Cyclobacteriaceae bacterium]